MITTDVRTDTPGAAQQSAPLGDNKTKSGPAILIAVLAMLALLVLGGIAVAFNGGGIGGAAQAPTGSNLRVAAANLLLDVTDRYFDNTDGTTVQLDKSGDSVTMHFSTVHMDAASSFEQVFARLGFDSNAYFQMGQTNGFAGVVTADAPNYTATWTYNSTDGLSISIAVKRGVGV